MASIASLAAASKVTGWNFHRMNPFIPSMYTTGPLMGLGIETLKTAGGYYNDLIGQQPTGGGPPHESAGTLAKHYGNLFNPLQGIVRTAGGVQDALQHSPMPAAATMRLLLTGQRGAGPDIEMQMRGPAEEMFKQSLQPLPPSPVRAGATGVQSGPTREQLKAQGMPDALIDQILGKLPTPPPAPLPPSGGGAQF
jgi:hypothetical protein